MNNKKEELKKYVSENVDKFYRLAFFCSRNQADAEDIVNESVARALDSIDGLRDIQYLSTWFYRIIVNTSNTYLKKKSKVVFLEDVTRPEESQEDQYADVDLYHKVMGLNNKYKIPIILKFYEDMTTEQIANILGENTNTVKTRIYTALRKLRENMDEELKFDEQKF